MDIILWTMVNWFQMKQCCSCNLLHEVINMLKCFDKVEPESLGKHNQQHHSLQRLLSAPGKKSHKTLQFLLGLSFHSADISASKDFAV